MLASGLGAQSIVVQAPGDLTHANLPARVRRGPLVVDVRFDRSIKMQKNGRFAALASVTRKLQLVS
jgi:hypothetical protein